MEPYKLGEMEQKFADLIWKHAPITTGELVKLCEQTFEWKRTTTYTMLKRLCLRNLFENVNGIVQVKTTREDFQAVQGEQFLMENFDGSLPRFLTAFSRRKKLSSREVEQLRKLIEEYEDETEGGSL